MNNNPQRQIDPDSLTPEKCNFRDNGILNTCRPLDELLRNGWASKVFKHITTKLYTNGVPQHTTKGVKYDEIYFNYCPFCGNEIKKFDYKDK